MDLETGRPDHIEDILMTLHTGQWFGWSDYKNKIYENLIIADPENVSPENKVLWGSWSTDKPTEKSLTDALAKAQAEFDAKDFSRKRQAEYPSIEECVHAILDDTLDALQAKRASIKLKYPKGG